MEDQDLFSEDTFSNDSGDSFSEVTTESWGEFFDLRKGTVHIPSRRRSNARTLQLESGQILDLIQFLNQDRQALEEIHQIKMETLFITRSNDLNNELKKVTNYCGKKPIRYIRASVISHLLRKYNLRQVQKMVGFRYVSSLERYEKLDTQELQAMIDRYHPIV